MDNLNEQLNKMRRLMGLVNESTLLEKMSNDEIYNKYYSNIPQEDFKKIIDADPTQKKDGSIGKYTKWMLGLHQKGNLKLEDLYKATEYLTAYAQNYNHVTVKDINQLKTLPDLYKVVEPFEKNSHEYDSNVTLQNNEDKVYEDNQWIVIVPKTKEASCYYGRGTKWCTAASDNNYEKNMFDHYNSQGTLYINIDKKNKRKYQFHFKERQFMDERDEEIQFPITTTIGMTQGLLDFYGKTLGEMYVGILSGNQKPDRIKTYRTEDNTLSFTAIGKSNEDLTKETFLRDFYFTNGPKVRESQNLKVLSEKFNDVIIVYNDFIYRINNTHFIITKGIPLPEKYRDLNTIKDIHLDVKRRESEENKKIMINHDVFDYKGNLLDEYYNNGVYIKDGSVYDAYNYYQERKPLYKFPLGNISKEELEKINIKFFSDYEYNIGTQAYSGRIMLEDSMWLDDVFLLHKGVIYADSSLNTPVMTFPIKYNSLEDVKDVKFKRDSREMKSFTINGVRYDQSKWDLHNKR